ncbi:putative E3 ubiquitin ligase SUD1, partial [Cucurbita argyrosperma subsp. sororia]
MEIAPAAAPSIDGDAAHDAASVDAVQASVSGNEANLSTAFPGPKYDDDEEEEDVCRICRNPKDADNPLSYPYACSGSIKFVHQDCLLQWLSHSNARQCEVCKHAFSFSPVYAENAPSRLPFQEFIFGIAMKACHVLQFFLRLSFVLSFWLLIIPFITFWIWRLAFHCIYISWSYLLERLLKHLRELGGQDGEREDDADRNGARAFRRPPGQANRNFAGDAIGEDAGGAPVLGGAGQMIRRNAENVAARLEMQAARLEAHVEQMFDVEDADGTEDVPFDELVGMQGPVFHLVENAFTVLASNMIFFGVVIFVPFTLDGKESGLLDQVAEMFKVNSSTLNNGTNNITAPLSVDVLKGLATASRLSDVTTLAVGYIFIFSLVFFYLGTVALIGYTRGEPLTMGRLYGITSVAEAIPSLLRQFMAAMRHLMTMVKVAFLLVIELGVFPLMCGWWLDICTAVGIVYMLQISIFVSLLRGVLRSGVLYFLRDPADPNYNPFRDLIDDPMHKHARRVLLSVAVYGSLIVMLVFLPVKLAMRMVPSIFPLDISVSDPFTEIPADMLLFQICIPFAIEHFKLRTTIKSLLRCWFTVVGWALGLTDYLLPRTEENVGQENGNGEPGLQDLQVIHHLGGPDQALVAHAAANEPNQVGPASGNLTNEEYDNEEQSDPERFRSGSDTHSKPNIQPCPTIPLLCTQPNPEIMSQLPREACEVNTTHAPALKPEITCTTHNLVPFGPVSLISDV